MQTDNNQPDNTVTQNDNLKWHHLPSNIYDLVDENDKVLDTIELIPKYSPPIYKWVLTARRKNGNLIEGWEFGKEETQEAALNALNKLLKRK